MESIDEDKLKRVLAEKLKQYRSKNQEMTAENAGISKDTISKIERGITIPNTVTLLKLCKALKITPNQLLEGLYETDTDANEDKSGDLVKDFEMLIKNYKIQ